MSATILPLRQQTVCSCSHTAHYGCNVCNPTVQMVEVDPIAPIGDDRILYRKPYSCHPEDGHIEYVVLRRKHGLHPYVSSRIDWTPGVTDPVAVRSFGGYFATLPEALADFEGRGIPTGPRWSETLNVVERSKGVRFV